MRVALCRLFSNHVLNFTNELMVEDVLAHDGVIVGGGSLLAGEPSGEPDAWSLLRSEVRPVFYVGVGLETNIHQTHRDLLTGIARVVATRSTTFPDWVQHITKVNDLVYTLPSCSDSTRNLRGSVLVIPNIEVVPMSDSPHWMHLSWDRCKDELAQFLDCCIEERQLRPSFLLMCRNETMDDAWAASEIIARMKNRSTSFELVRPSQIDTVELTNYFSEHDFVVTQRFHGIILSQMARVPCIAIDHHDKLKLASPAPSAIIPYHGINKGSLLGAMKTAKFSEREELCGVNESYKRVALEIVSVVNTSRRSRGEPVCRHS